MESFQFTRSSENPDAFEIAGCYDFSSVNLDSIPYPDDSCMDDLSNPTPEDVDLPPPPGAQDNEPFVSFDYKNALMPCNTSKRFSPPLAPPPPPSPEANEMSVDATEIPMPDSLEMDKKNVSGVLPILPDEDNPEDSHISSVQNISGEHHFDVRNETKKFVDDNKYSPSKIESDDENQEFAMVKPKVLGKEQAKKRLLAFSLSKQPNVKKQNKIVTPLKTTKEKPPNPNKSSGVQEQFRATISAIEEEKKKMMQNMPNYLLLEMNDLSKSSNTIIKNPLQLLEKQKNESSDSNTKESSNKSSNYSSKSNDLSKSKDSTKKGSSRSRSVRRSQSRSRKRRSRSRKRSKSLSKSRKRSPDRNRRSRSRTRRIKEDKNYKSDKKDTNVLPKKESPENWKGFVAAGLVLVSGTSKQFTDETLYQKEEEWGRPLSPKSRHDFKPIFSYLKNGPKSMGPLQVKTADHGDSILFAEKTVKYTLAKPSLIWTENPSHATDFYMSRQMLLENCDQATTSILHTIIESKNKSQLEDDDFFETKGNRSRPWYYREDHLNSFISPRRNASEPEVPRNKNSSEKAEEDYLNEKPEICEKEIAVKEEPKIETKEKPKIERNISLVNDSYMSDEEAKVEEVVVGDVKVQLDLGLNCVKVRSKWDSDYEGENSEKEPNSNKEADMEIDSAEERTDVFTTSRVSPEDVDKKSVNLKTNESSVKIQGSSRAHVFLSPQIGLQNVGTDEPTGNLVSEYEEFLKMVSFNSNDSQANQELEGLSIPSVASTKLEKQKEMKEERSEKGKTSKFEATDWDQESDHEEKTLDKKVIYNKSECSSELLIQKEEKSKKKKKIKKTDTTKKKTEKLKGKKNKSSKISIKGKKKKYKDSSSSDSSSDSQGSDSDSESDDSKAGKKKKKKKKVTKTKKQSKKASSSDTDSETDDGKSKKKKSKKKKSVKKKKNASSDSEEEMENALLKQLDFKKQLIIKKLEEIDSISERSGKKKEKDNRPRKKEKEGKEGTELLEKYSKSEKKKKTVDKGEKKKKKYVKANKKSMSVGKISKGSKKSESSSESDSDSSEIDVKKKSKKKRKKKRASSESNDGREKVSKSSKQDKVTDIKNLKSSEKGEKKSKKSKKEKRKSVTSSPSESDESVIKSKKKVKKKKNKKGKGETNFDEMSKCSWKENFPLEETNYENNERQFRWRGRKVPWKISERKTKPGKEGDDWEASSSFEESKSTESSWDDEAPPSGKKPDSTKDSLPKEEPIKSENSKIVPEKHTPIQEMNICDKSGISDTVQDPPKETLKNSLSNFSFNENSFCSFGQELSRDFFFTERSFSNSSYLPGDAENLGSSTSQPRAFQSITENSEIKKPANSELYSPGYSDSEVSESEAETNTKSDIANSVSNACSVTKEEIYDPLNCESEGSAENNEVELSNIPLPQVSEILLPGETRNFLNIGVAVTPPSESNLQKSLVQTEIKNEKGFTASPKQLSVTITKNSFSSTDFTPVKASNSEEQTTPKKQVMSVKAQQKLISKAAPVFQDESDDEDIETSEKGKTTHCSQRDSLERSKKKEFEDVEVTRTKTTEPGEEKKNEELKREKKRDRDGSREKSRERERKRRRSSSREKRDFGKSPRSRRSRTPDLKPVKEKREIKSDSFEIEPLKCSTDLNGLEESVQPIPVLTGLGVPSSEKVWNTSHLPGYACNEFSDAGNIIDHAESFDIYPSGDSKCRHLDKDFVDREEGSGEKLNHDKSLIKEERGRKDKRRSHSRSPSPKKRRRSKSPEKRKSPRRRSASPKRKERSSYSPRRRSPKRKSPSRRYRSSRSPDRRRKSRSRSPRKKRSSPCRRSRSASPRKHRSPKRRVESPRKRDSPTKGFSPRKSVSPTKDSNYPNNYSETFQNRIPVIGVSCEDEMKRNSSGMHSPGFESLGFSRHMPDSTLNESDINNSFYNRDYSDEFGMTNYSEENGTNNLITVKSHTVEKSNSPERLSLDQRIELELGVHLTSNSQPQNEQYQMPNQPCPPFQDPNHFQNTYGCDNSANNDNFYQSQNMQMNSDFNSHYFNQQPPNYPSFQPYSNSQPVQSSVMQVGNIVEVVPAMQHPPPPPPVAPKPHQIMQVGNVLQVVPSPKVPPCPPVPSPAAPLNYGPPSAAPPLVKTQKATAVVAPSSIVPTPNPEAVINPLIKAIQMEREKRRKEKEKRKAEREARRKARQLRREAKLMSVNEKLKKSVQDEGLMLGQEVEDDELLDGSDLPSPPIPVEIITVSSQGALPPSGKGILITAGFMPKPPSEKKEVKFADGVCPGEGTSTSGGEDIASPPPKPRLPKEKRYKKKKTKVKKKVKVQIIRQIIQDEDDDDDDDLSPPPPPPGSPPPVFFARFPFAGEAQFPVYQTQTTTTTLTTVQYPAQPFQ